MIRAVEGAAGCGKTYHLMEMLAETLAAHPLAEGQRVLALTFMHGARRRLADKLRSVPGLAGRLECCTIDSFALRLYRRWRGLAAALDIAPCGERDFDQVCDAAGRLLEQAEVRDWTSASFPIVLVDEGQDLKPERLRMLVALEAATHTLLAADEFQCLNQALRPNPLVAWMQAAPAPEALVHVRRTDRPGLLAAATAIRAGQPPVEGDGFRILRPGVSPALAATLLANAIAWRQGGDVAVITPALEGGFATNAVARVCAGACGARGNGPYAVRWEGSDRDDAAALVAGLDLALHAPAGAVIAALSAMSPCGPVRATIAWVENQVHAVGRADFAREEIETVIARQVMLRRQHGGNAAHNLTALTVQQAKNREFEGVVVLWPFRVGGDAEHKRRLLYNAVTRAKRWCHVIVQSPKILAAPPFV